MTNLGGRIHNIHYGDILIKYNEIISLKNTEIECLTAEGETHAPKDYVQDGDIIIADTAEDEMVGKTVEVQEIGKRKVLSGLHTVFYRPPANIFVRGWLGYWMNSSAYHNQLFQYMTGTKVLSLSKASLADTIIQYPSIDEQLKIVTALEEVQRQITILESLIVKHESIKKATVKMLMTPTAEWQEATLGDFYTVSSGLSKGAEFFGSGYPFLSFVTVFNNPIIPDRLDNLVESSAYERKQCSVRRGDVFLTRTSETLDELGMSSVALQDYPDATFNGFTKRLRPIEGIPLCPEFMAFYLRTENFRKSICQKASITTRASLNKDTIEKLVIAYPIPSVQREIAKNLMTMDKQRMILVEELDKLKQLKQSMLQYFFG